MDPSGLLKEGSNISGMRTPSGLAFNTKAMIPGKTTIKGRIIFKKAAKAMPFCASFKDLAAKVLCIIY